MSKKKSQRKRYTEEFKREAVRLLDERGSRPAHDVAQELGVQAGQLYQWRKEYGPTLKRPAGMDSYAEENRELRTRLAQLEKENTLLKKSVAVIVKDLKL